jgi:hypothetical protein
VCVNNAVGAAAAAAADLCVCLVHNCTLCCTALGGAVLCCTALYYNNWRTALIVFNEKQNAAQGSWTSSRFKYSFSLLELNALRI